MLYDIIPRDLDEKLHGLKKLNDQILNEELRTEHENNNPEEGEEDVPVDVQSIRTESVATTTSSALLLNYEITHYFLPFLNNLIKSFYSFYEEISEVEQLDFRLTQLRKSLITKGPGCNYNIRSSKQLFDIHYKDTESSPFKNNSVNSLELCKFCEILDSILFLQTKLLNSYNNKHNTLKIDYNLDLLYSIFLNPRNFGLKESEHVKTLKLEIFNALTVLFNSEYNV
ncbi:hypothetical protein RNJ44_01201 [Nakaseomyces bracarensis]|uniref:Uncharacterized protein n=1 Tax=Nakaseomyces bracarensis TaxID=273131 RepID=A0ABR4NRA9_9SACH